jgi:hypothetical protein
MASRIVVGAYFAVAVAGAAVVDRVEGDRALVTTMVVLLAIAVVAGIVIARWRAIWLAVTPVVVAIPFGELDADRGDVFGYAAAILVYLAPVSAALIALGVLAARLRARGSSRSAT